jgi:hypothetical protein
MLIFFGIFLAIDYDHNCMSQNRKQVGVFVAYLVIFKIPVNVIKSYTLRKYHKESISGIVCGTIAKVFLTAWMIYSYVNFFNMKDTNVCKNYWPIFLYLAYGFYVFLQACIFACFAAVISVFCCFFYRRMMRPNWTGANNQILNRLVRTRFTPENYNEDEACSV